MSKAFESLYENKEAAKMNKKDAYRIKAKEYFMRSRSPNKVPKADGGYTTFTPSPRKKASFKERETETYRQRREVEAKPLEPQDS